MTKAKILEILSACMNEKDLCRVFLKYEAGYRYYYPIRVDEKLFIGEEEDDFILDGYSIRRIRDITKAQIKDDLCVDILKKEGVTERISDPGIDISSWKAAFESLLKREKNIIVEKESLEDKNCKFVIGRIEKIKNKHVYVRHFDADGVWQDEPIRIPYSEITSVTFETRYVNTFSKYLKTLPDNFLKS